MRVIRALENFTKGCVRLFGVAFGACYGPLEAISRTLARGSIMLINTCNASLNYSAVVQGVYALSVSVKCRNDAAKICSVILCRSELAHYILCSLSLCSVDVHLFHD